MDGEEENAQPERFPNPFITNSAFRRLKVIINNDTGQIERKGVIASGSGQFYEVGVTLKKAIFGQVIHAILLTTVDNDTYKRTSQQRAIKIYAKKVLRALQGRTAENPLTEITALQFIGDNHPNIMGQVECCTDDDNIYSIMRFCPGGELFDFIDQNGPMENPQAKSMFTQLMSGLSHLHSLGIGHRDMSLENILFDGVDRYIIIDFGMCLRLPKTPHLPGGYRSIAKQQVCGKRNYIAPEVLREDRIFNPMLCDIWAAGVILFISLTGVPPVDSAIVTDERYRMICEGRLYEMVQSWEMDMDPLAADLIQQILRANPVERLTIEQIQAHPWMTSVDNS